MKISKKTGESIALACSVILSLAIVVTGIAFTVSAMWINGIGKNPFTYENISFAFSRISPIVYATLILLIGSVVVWFILPVEERGLRATRDVMTSLARLSAERDITAAQECDRVSVRREQIKRKILLTVNIALLVIGSAVALIYCLDSRNFTDDYNSSVIGAAICAALSMLPAAVLLCARAFLDPTSAERELAILRKLPKKSVNGGACNDFATKNAIFSAIFGESDTKLFILRAIIFAVAFVFIVLGIYNGGMNDVLQKGIKICTECIGLG